MSPKDTGAATQTNTCDRCRVLKVKCVPVDKEDGVESVDSSLVGSSSTHAAANGHGNGQAGDATGDEAKKQPCKRCFKAGVGCVFRYEFKKSGRPPGSTAKRARSKERSASRRSASPVRRASSSTQPPQTNHADPHPNSHSHSRSHTYTDLRQPEQTFLSPINQPTDAHQPVHEHEHPWGPIRDSIFGSARTALEGANVSADTTQPWLSGLFSRRPSFDFSLPPEQDGFDAVRGGGGGTIGGSTPGQSRGPMGPGMIDLGLGGMSSGPGSMGGPSSVGPNFGPSPAGSTLSAGPAAQMQQQSQQSTAPGMMGAMGMGGAPMGGQAGLSGMGMGTMDKWGTTAPQIKSDYFSNLGGPMIQVEAIGTWSEFCFFVSLFMRHQHALVPLIHKPTFAMDVLNRKDQRDEAFRGLLFSIVTYTICQCPINMMSNDFSRERLLTLLERCQQASRLIQIRYLSRPNLIVAASTELDILSSQATNKPELTAALFSDAQRMAYTLRLNAVTPPEGASAVDVELGRRIFWHLYSTDKTNVMNGGYMLLHHHEIIPPLPLEIDDEHLSTSPSQPHPQLSPAVAQTPNKQTYISGFVALCRIFVILGECQQRHRTLINDPEAGQDMPTLMRWLDGAVERLRRITDGFASDLPLRTSRALSGSNAGGMAGMAGAGGAGMGMDSDSEATAGIQQANICITALCAEFALLDFRLALRPEEDLRSEREKIAKKAYATLSGIPIEYLASNGEAMRGKVLRTILALFNASTSPEELGDSVWDWWSMYSQVQFVQVIPSN